MKCYVGEYVEVYKSVEEKYHPQIRKMIHTLSFVHPRDFPAYVQKWRESDPEMVVWTNHPYLVDYFQGKEVYVLCQGQVKTLDQHPRYAELVGQFRTGEFWSFVAESWILGDQTWTVHSKVR